MKHGGDGVAWFRGPIIGKGSFGSVYLANLKRPKSRFGCFPPTMAVKSAEVSVSGSIQKEREVLGNIGRCSNLIQCYGDEITTEPNGAMVYNLLLEYGSGGTVADLIKRSDGKGLIESDVRYYTRCILRGLNHIHECGYVHCDLKPENLLLVANTNNSGRKFDVKIGDFGLAKRAKPNKKRKLDPYLRGTPMYLSPEAAKDNIQEAPSDIWALGCIVLEMFTGKPPWEGIEYSDTKSLLDIIGDSYNMPNIPSGISKEGKEFLKGCFSRKSMYRLTAEMLLYHSFVEGLPDDEGDDEEGEMNLITNCESERDFVLSSVSDDCGFWSDEEMSIFSCVEKGNESRGREEVTRSIVDSTQKVSTTTILQCPLSFTISTGV